MESKEAQGDGAREIQDLKAVAAYFAPVMEELSAYLKHHAGFRELIQGKVMEAKTWDDLTAAARYAALQSVGMENRIAIVVKTMAECINKLHRDISAH